MISPVLSGNALNFQDNNHAWYFLKIYSSISHCPSLVKSSTIVYSIYKYYSLTSPFSQWNPEIFCHGVHKNGARGTYWNSSTVPAKATICAQPLRGTLLKAAKPGRFCVRTRRRFTMEHGGDFHGFQEIWMGSKDVEWEHRSFWTRLHPDSEGDLMMFNDYIVGFHSLNVFRKNHWRIWLFLSHYVYIIYDFYPIINGDCLVQDVNIGTEWVSIELVISNGRCLVGPDEIFQPWPGIPSEYGLCIVVVNKPISYW